MVEDIASWLELLCIAPLYTTRTPPLPHPHPCASPPVPAVKSSEEGAGLYEPYSKFLKGGYIGDYYKGY